MDEFYEIEGGRWIGVGTKAERWLGGRPVDWGDVTKLLPGQRVLVSWQGTADTLIHDVEDIVDICVDDWSAEARALIARRQDASGAEDGVRTERTQET